MNKTLFAISADAAALEDLLEEIGGDISDPGVAEAIDDWLNQIRNDTEVKLDGYAALITELESRAEARRAEAKRLAELARTDENKASRLKERLRLFFEERGLDKVETMRYRLSLAGNGGKAPLILRDDLSVNDIPDRFTRPELDTTAVREALERGEELDFARLGERGTSIRIK